MLLSATPAQNNLIELYNLLTLLKPGIFKTQKEFRAAYMTAGKPRQPANPERLRLLMRDAMIRNTRAVVALKLPRRHAATRRVDPSPAELAAYQELADLIRARAADGSESRRIAGRRLLGAAGSSPAAATAAIARFAARQGGDPAQTLLPRLPPSRLPALRAAGELGRRGRLRRGPSRLKSAKDLSRLFLERLFRLRRNAHDETEQRLRRGVGLCVSALDASVRQNAV